MHALITTVLSLALTAMTALIGINYVNPLLPVEKQSQGLLETGLKALQDGWDAYRIHNQTFSWVCDTFTTEGNTYEDCQKELDDPGYLPVQGWSALLSPLYIFIPQPLAGTSWTYNQNAQGSYFCLSGKLSKPQLVGAFRARQSFPVDSFFIADACGALSGYERNQVAQGGDYAITYWLRRAY